MCARTPDGETTSTLHYFSVRLHDGTYRMTPMDTHSFIPIPSKTCFCKTLSNLGAKLATFQNHSSLTLLTKFLLLMETTRKICDTFALNANHSTVFGYLFPFQCHEMKLIQISKT